MNGLPLFWSGGWMGQWEEGNETGIKGNQRQSVTAGAAPPAESLGL